MDKLKQLNKEIIACKKCPRLVPYLKEVAEKKVRRYADQEYWGKPVPGFGDPNAKVLIIGLAPGAHGANRTGRMFTGDDSGNWLYGALYETGFASQKESNSVNDGMQLTDVYITSAARCAPPQNKLIASELNNCSPFLEAELKIFDQAKVILCLGGIAFNRYTRINQLKRLKFGHGIRYALDDGKTLIASYHPSRQNTNTGRLLWPDWLQVFQDIRQIINP